ncbi:MAG: SHOCT domain-containing protein [Bacteroidota bacterium]
MSNPNKERLTAADMVIRNHVIWSMGAGLIPVLIADIFAVSALQLDMIRQLCRVYEVDFQETQGKAIVTSLTSSTLARIGAGSLIKMIPGLGSVLGGVTVSVFAGASTYALGEVFKKHFESGGTILDFDPDRLRKYYKEKFEKGKKVAQDWQNQSTDDAGGGFSETTVATDDQAANPEPAATPREEPAAPVNPNPVEETKDVIARLKELGELKANGVITEEEFEQMKKKLIDEF